MSFDEIEAILGFTLPVSARTYSAWWANNPQPNRQSNAWLSAGWKTDDLDLDGETVTFRLRDSMPLENGRRVIPRKAKTKRATNSDGPEGHCHLWTPPVCQGIFDLRRCWGLQSSIRPLRAVHVDRGP